MSSTDENLVQLEGTIERIVYENEQNGFFVARLREANKTELTTFVGNLMAVAPGETVRLWGRWVDDRRWGRQLRVERYETLVPGTVAGIEKYLGSGLINGIGPAFAKRLVDAFGAETLRIIDEHPERLRRVPGIGRMRAQQIRTAWQAQKGIQNIMIFLQGHGISTGQAVKIYKRYGDTAVAVLRDNPYRLANEIAGIGFKSADKIATSLGMDKDSAKRMEAGLIFALDEAAGNGHVFLPQPLLIEEAARLLDISATLLEQPLDTLCQRKMLIRENDAIYLPSLHTDEEGCRTQFKRILAIPVEDVSIQIEKAIPWLEQNQGVQFSEEQRLAIQYAAQAKVLVITGGPGTGKTTLIRGLLTMFEKKGLTVLLAAPTGRAAKRMEATTDHSARTLHRLLEYSPKEGEFQRNENNPLQADLIVIDETSMIDVRLMHNLLRAVPAHARLFFVGDVDQLPSVGPGNVLMDIIASGLMPVVWLKTVFRQAGENGIVSNAHHINHGEYPTFNTTDFFFVERKTPERAVETVLELVTVRIPRKFGFDPLREIQVLAPMHRGDAGVARLNETIQQAVNPAGRPLPKKSLRIGDKVMQLRNNYELDVYNGDIGFITALDEEAHNVEVHFDDKTVLYGFDDLDDLTLAYAITVHKSQGSEYPAVIIPLLPQHFLLLQRNVLYTAVTRSKKLVILVGDPKAVNMAIQNNRVSQRHTHLVERLRNQI